jgi:integrase/recombinase XerC
MEQIKTAFCDYLQKEKGYSEHTILAYCTDLNVFHGFLLANFDQENLLEVNYSQIRSWIVQLVDSGLSTLSVNRKVASLKSFYRFLLKTKQILVNPLSVHKSLKVSKKIQIPFSEMELNTVLDSQRFPEGFEGIRDRLIIELLYTTGMRRAELIGLELGAIDFSNESLKVFGKGNKERIIPVLQTVLTQMEVYLDARSNLVNITDFNNFFLTSKGSKLSNSFVYKLINCYFSDVSKKSKKSPHVLRHTFATHLLNNGADLNSVKDLLGHSSLASTQIYTNSSLAQIKKIYCAAHPRGQTKSKD